MDADRSVSRIKCLVPSCRNSRNRNPKLSFHTFPKINTSLVGNITESGLKEKIDRYKAWNIKLKLHKSPPRAASVCYLHFKRDDFLLPAEAFKTCHLSDANFDVCLASTIENAFRIIGSTGISFLNIPPIDPLQITSIKMVAGTKAVNLKHVYEDVKVFGFSDIEVKKAHYDTAKKILTFVSYHPEIIQESKYEMTGNIMILPVFGKGDSKIVLRNATVEHTVIFKTKTKNNKIYLIATKYTAIMNIEGSHVDFKNLFNGDEKLGNNLLTVINDNWRAIYEDVRGGVQEAYGEVFKKLTNGFCENIPADEIFLE